MKAIIINNTGPTVRFGSSLRLSVCTTVITVKTAPENMIRQPTGCPAPCRGLGRVKRRHLQGTQFLCLPET